MTRKEGRVLGNGAVIFLQEAKCGILHTRTYHIAIPSISLVVHSTPEPHTIPQHVNFLLVSRDTKLFAICNKIRRDKSPSGHICAREGVVSQRCSGQLAERNHSIPPSSVQVSELRDALAPSSTAYCQAARACTDSVKGRVSFQRASAGVTEVNVLLLIPPPTAVISSWYYP